MAGKGPATSVGAGPGTGPALDAGATSSGGGFNVEVSQAGATTLFSLPGVEATSGGGHSDLIDIDIEARLTGRTSGRQPPSRTASKPRRFT